MGSFERWKRREVEGETSKVQRQEGRTNRKGKMAWAGVGQV